MLLGSPRPPLLPAAPGPGHRRLAVLGVSLALAGALAYAVVSSTNGAVLLTNPTGATTADAPSITFTDPVGFTYTMTAHQATETATGDPQYPVTPAPPGLDYIVIDATVANATSGRPAPGDLSQVGLALEVPVADIAAAIPPSAYPTALTTGQFLSAGCADLAVFLPNIPRGQHGYGGNENYFADDWQTTSDGAHCLIPLADASIIATPTFDGPGTLPAKGSAQGDYVTVDPLPTTIARHDMTLTTESSQKSGWITGSSAPLPW